MPIVGAGYASLPGSGSSGAISKIKTLGYIDAAATLVVLTTGLMFAVYDRGNASQPFGQGNVY